MLIYVYIFLSWSCLDFVSRCKKRKIDDKVLVVDTPVVSLAENSMTDLKDFSQNQIIYKKVNVMMYLTLENLRRSIIICHFLDGHFNGSYAEQNKWNTGAYGQNL